jgi:chitinase
MQGIGCNLVSNNDSTNFLSFLKTLRRHEKAKDLIISAAVSLKPFLGKDGKPMSDVSGFGEVLDYIGSLSLIKTHLSFSDIISRNYGL